MQKTGSFVGSDLVFSDAEKIRELARRGEGTSESRAMLEHAIGVIHWPTVSQSRLKA
jgi:hypothetical protein